MATPRRGLHKSKPPLSPFCTRQSNSISKRHPSPNSTSYSNPSGSYSDYEEIESEGFDETDRCTTIHYSEEDSKFDLHVQVSNQESQQKKRPQKDRLYPNLNEVEEEEASRRHHNGPTPAILISIVLLIICSILGFGQLYMWSERSHFGDPEWNVSLEQIYNETVMGLKMLRRETQQSKQFWVQVFAELKLLKEDSPQHPAILLALVPIDSQNTAVCLSHKIVNLVSTAFRDEKAITFDTHSSSHGNAVAQKHELDQALLGLDRLHAAVVYNIEKVAPAAAMIFHAYCDTENAPFKRALLLLMLGIDRYYSPQLIENLDSTAHDLLMSLWATSLREDNVAAIVARIANAPIIFIPEKEEVIRRLCPY